MTGVSLLEQGAGVQQLWILLWCERWHLLVEPLGAATIAAMGLKLEAVTTACSLTCTANLCGLKFPRDSVFKREIERERERECFINNRIHIHDALMIYIYMLTLEDNINWKTWKGKVWAWTELFLSIFSCPQLADLRLGCPQGMARGNLLCRCSPSSRNRLALNAQVGTPTLIQRLLCPSLKTWLSELLSKDMHFVGQTHS